MAARRAARLAFHGAGPQIQPLFAARISPSLSQPVSSLSRADFWTETTSPPGDTREKDPKAAPTAASSHIRSLGRRFFQGCSGSVGLERRQLPGPTSLDGGVRRAPGFHSGGILYFSSAGAESTAVVAVQTASEFNSAITEAPLSQLVVVDFTAHWCMPCQRIAPFLDELSLKLSGVTILKVDIDSAELQEVVESARVSAVPTFQFYKAGKLLSTFSGADRNKLQDTIQLLVNA